MRTKRVLRYWCDYCNKSMGSKNGMQTHERHCTMNPNRYCRMCNGRQKPIKELSNAANKGLTELRAVAYGCPACMLSGIRQREHIPLTIDISTSLDNFHFKEETKKMWDARNAEIIIDE